MKQKSMNNMESQREITINDWNAKQTMSEQPGCALMVLTLPCQMADEKATNHKITTRHLMEPQL